VRNGLSLRWAWVRGQQHMEVGEGEKFRGEVAAEHGSWGGVVERGDHVEEDMAGSKPVAVDRGLVGKA